MILLPVVVIVLVVMCVYLSYQKNISVRNKIIIAVLAVLIFNIAYGFMKRTTEQFTGDNAASDGATYDVEETSPDYDSGGDVADDQHPPEPYVDTAAPPMRKPGIAEVIGAADSSNIISELTRRTPMPSQSATMAPSESFSDATPMPTKYSYASDVLQHDVRGVGNIFNPQVIIKSMQQQQPPTSAASWQTPERDLWGGDPGQPPARQPVAPAKNNRISPKAYYPGYSFAPPASWDVPQQRPPVCVSDSASPPREPMGVFDRGTPTNALELTESGEMCMSESECHLTNVGSIMPKFEFREISAKS